MISFHLTELKNLRSILTAGLVGQRPKLDHHLERFQDGGLEGEKVVYSWGQTWATAKYACDMIYCKQWINPRNDLITKPGERYNFSKAPDFKFKNKRYVLLKIDTKDDESSIFGSYTHSQYPSDDPFDSLYQMESRFAHDAKPLVMFKEKVKPEYIIPIELYDSEVTKGKLYVRNRPYEGWGSKAHSSDHGNG